MSDAETQRWLREEVLPRLDREGIVFPEIWVVEWHCADNFGSLPPGMWAVLRGTAAEMIEQVEAELRRLQVTWERPRDVWIVRGPRDVGRLVPRLIPPLGFHHTEGPRNAAAQSCNAPKKYGPGCTCEW